MIGDQLFSYLNWVVIYSEFAGNADKYVRELVAKREKVKCDCHFGRERENNYLVSC